MIELTNKEQHEAEIFYILNKLTDEVTLCPNCVKEFNCFKLMYKVKGLCNLCNSTDSYSVERISKKPVISIDDAKTRLKEILDTMKIPEERKDDLYWLSRNISINNYYHHSYNEAIMLIKRIIRYNHYNHDYWKNCGYK